MADPGSTDLTVVIDQVRIMMAQALDRLTDALRQMARETSQERERLRQLENLVRQVTEQPKTGGEPATPLEQLIGELARKQHEHEVWLSNLSQRLTSDRLSSDQLTAGEYLEHVEISARYRHLIGQRLLDLAAAPAAPGALAEARVRACLARALFDPESIAAGFVRAQDALRRDGVPVPADLFQSLWDEAEEIRRDAAATGHHCRWLFDAEPGVPVDPSSQEVCEGCAAGDPVAFVLAPAYVVDGRIHVKQLIFTQSAPAGPPAATPLNPEPVVPSQGENTDGQ